MPVGEIGGYVRHEVSREDSDAKGSETKRAGGAKPPALTAARVSGFQAVVGQQPAELLKVYSVQLMAVVMGGQQDFQCRKV